MREFAAEIQAEQCWDAETEALVRSRHFPGDCILQIRGELVAFCEWIDQNDIRSYLEIGVWTGKLFLLLNRLFQFEKAAACDLGACRAHNLPFHLEGTNYPVFVGNSHSIDYKNWLARQGQFDLILIDGDHSYEGIRDDFAVNRDSAGRFIAFHDITGSHVSAKGVKMLWDSLEGRKVEILRPHVEVGSDQSSMGIGIWSI